ASRLSWNAAHRGTHRTWPGRCEGQGRQVRPQAEPHPSPAEGGPQAPRRRRDAAQRCSQLQCKPELNFEAWIMTAGRDERRQQVIRERAYAIWEQKGHPDAMELAHWLQAEAEIDPTHALLTAIRDATFVSNRAFVFLKKIEWQFRG